MTAIGNGTLPGRVACARQKTYLCVCVCAGKQRGFAFATMTCLADVQKAIKMANGQVSCSPSHGERKHKYNKMWLP